MPNEPLVILNPASAAGRTGRRRDAIAERVVAALGPVEFRSTSGPADATRLASTAVAAGVRRLLVAGGDGTLNEVVTGLFGNGSRDPGALPALGLLPLGSGWDFARSLELPRDLDAALAVIARGATRTIDIGQVAYRDEAGEPRTRFFANEASAGLPGVAIRIVGRLVKRVGPRIGFVLGGIAAVLSHRSELAEIVVDDECVYAGPVSMVVAANGAFFGAGMRVAPGARPDDGLFEVVIVRGLSVPRLLGNLPSLLRGTHGDHPSVSFHAARSVRVTQKEISGPIDVDGEAAGRLPMLARIIPSAVRVFAPEPGP